MPSLLVFIPLLTIIVLNMPFGRAFMHRAAFWFAAAFFLVQAGVAFAHHPALGSHALTMTDAFFRVTFSLDHLSFVMFLLIGIVSLTSLVIARSTIYDDEERFKFINLLVITSIGMSGIVLARDLFSLYVFLEITAVSSFILIAYRKDREALEGAFKYFLLSFIATIMMLAAIALILLVSPDPSFASVKTALAASSSSAIVTLAVGLFLAGLFIKGGIVPFHGWLPDAYMTAPGPVAVLLAGIITKAAGIYTLLRITTAVFGLTEPVRAILLGTGALSVVVGAFGALGQSDFKRLLAYSSISQVGYIVIGFGTGSVLGIAGAVLHLFNHAIFKSLLFVNATAIETQTGTTDMTTLGGIAERMPVTGATSVIAMLSTCGIPPLAGFWSKLVIIVALWGTGHPVYAAIAVFASLITLAYFLTLQRRVFFGTIAEAYADLGEANRGIVIASIMLAAITIGVGIAFPFVFTHFIAPLKELLG